MRAAHCYGASQVTISGERGNRSYSKMLSSCTNTTAAHRHIPTFTTVDPLDYRPIDCQVVVVDLIEGAKPLPEFVHPQRAIYVFGPEDGTLGRRITDRAQHIVSVPTHHCMNLAATVNVILYDRAAKGLPFDAVYPGFDRKSFYERNAS
jgi:tRNA(Leu) C34 or U34 (ribose-2'-O)-methylase TrmL